MHRFIAALFVAILIGLNIFLFSDQFSFHEIQIVSNRGTFTLKVELAKTFREKQKGLMDRRRLEVGRGMLFVYSKPVFPSFWMKNTLIPLDMIFIGDDLKIKYIEHKVPPCLEELCPTYRPPQPVQYVLEVPGGYAQLFKVKEGDLLKFVDPIELL